jgi:hypothetical protein
MGRMLKEVLVSGDDALMEVGNHSNSLFIVQIISRNGISKSMKVMR